MPETAFDQQPKEFTDFLKSSQSTAMARWIDSVNQFSEEQGIEAFRIKNWTDEALYAMAGPASFVLGTDHRVALITEPSSLYKNLQVQQVLGENQDELYEVLASTATMLGLPLQHASTCNGALALSMGVLAEASARDMGIDHVRTHSPLTEEFICDAEMDNPEVLALAKRIGELWAEVVAKKGTTPS